MCAEIQVAKGLFLVGAGVPFHKSPDIKGNYKRAGRRKQLFLLAGRGGGGGGGSSRTQISKAPIKPACRKKTLNPKLYTLKPKP